MNDNSINDSSSSINDDNSERSMFDQGIRNFLNCGACINDSIQECKVMQECAASLSEVIMSEENQFKSIQSYITNIYSANNKLLKFLVGKNNMYQSFEDSQRNGNKLFKINDGDTRDQKNCKNDLNKVFKEEIRVDKKLNKMLEVIGNYKTNNIDNPRNNDHAYYNNHNLNNDLCILQ